MRITGRKKPRCLTCFPSVFDWRRSLSCRRSRSLLLCTGAPQPPPARPAQSQPRQCRLRGSNQRERAWRVAMSGGKLRTCCCNALTDFHELRRTLCVARVVLGSAVVLSRVLFPHRNKFLHPKMTKVWLITASVSCSLESSRRGDYEKVWKMLALTIYIYNDIFRIMSHTPITSHNPTSYVIIAQLGH